MKVEVQHQPTMSSYHKFRFAFYLARAPSRLLYLQYFVMTTISGEGYWWCRRTCPGQNVILRLADKFSGDFQPTVSLRPIFSSQSTLGFTEIWWRQMEMEVGEKDCVQTLTEQLGHTEKGDYQIEKSVLIVSPEKLVWVGVRWKLCGTLETCNLNQYYYYIPEFIFLISSPILILLTCFPLFGKSLCSVSYNFLYKLWPAMQQFKHSIPRYIFRVCKVQCLAPNGQFEIIDQSLYR